MGITKRRAYYALVGSYLVGASGINDDAEADRVAEETAVLVYEYATLHQIAPEAVVDFAATEVARLLAEAVKRAREIRGTPEKQDAALNAAVEHIRKLRAMDPLGQSLEELNALTEETRRLCKVYADAAGVSLAVAIGRVFQAADAPG